MRCKATVTALLVATTVLVGMAGSATADPVPTLTVSVTAALRAGAIDVTVAGCQDDFQWAEVRLVVGAGLARRSIAVASDDGTDDAHDASSHTFCLAIRKYASALTVCAHPGEPPGKVMVMPRMVRTTLFSIGPHVLSF